MITRRTIRDVGNGEQVVLEGAPEDRLPQDNTVMIDPRSGEVFGPGYEFGRLPTQELMQLPRTTWYCWFSIEECIRPPQLTWYGQRLIDEFGQFPHFSCCGRPFIDELVQFPQFTWDGRRRIEALDQIPPTTWFATIPAGTP